MRDGGEILTALDEASRGVQAASTKLAKLINEFGEASVDANGQLHEGTKLRYEVALQEELSTLYTLAISDGRRPPAEDVRAALAARAVRVKDPQLHADYHAQKTQIEALKLWLSNQRQVISGYQSLRRGEAT